MIKNKYGEIQYYIQQNITSPRNVLIELLKYMSVIKLTDSGITFQSVSMFTKLSHIICLKVPM